MRGKIRISGAVLSALVALFSIGALADNSPGLAVSATKAYGANTQALEAFAKQSVWLIGGGLLLGLGIGIVVASVGTYLYKRRHIRNRLQA